MIAPCIDPDGTCYFPAMRKALYLFGLLTDADIDWMARVGVRRRMMDGEILIGQGTPIDSIFMVLEGRFSVIVKDGVIAQRHAGDILGEMSMVDSAPPSATVTTEGECLVLCLDKNVLLQRLATDLAFGCRFYKALAVILADRLREIEHPVRSNNRDELAAKNDLKDELDGLTAGSVARAQERFDRMLKILTRI
jgi:CRP/FNR family cyclic AMP-dependent transcriptional regulator